MMWKMWSGDDVERYTAACMDDVESYVIWLDVEGSCRCVSLDMFEDDWLDFRCSCPTNQPPYGIDCQ